MSVTLARAMLRGACWITVLTGLVAFGGSHPTLAEPWRALFDLVQWPLDGNPAALDGSAPVLSAISGGLMAGWGALMLRLCRRPRPPYGDMLFALTIWFVVDSTGSGLAQVWGNVVLNAGFYLMFLVPLTRLRREA